METIQQQIGTLQVIVQQQQAGMKRQRFAIIALAGIIVAGGFMAAVRPVGDVTFDTITCKEWNVVDADGKERITAFTNPNGTASVQWKDKDEKLRIVASINANGQAGMQWADKNEKVRIAASTNANGQAGMQWIDKDGKWRIAAGTHEDGSASVEWADKDQDIRILAATLANGNVYLPTQDEKHTKKSSPKKP